MGLLDKLFTPKYKSKDPQVRLKVANETTDEKILFEIAKDHRGIGQVPYEAQKTALNKITNQQLLLNIATSSFQSFEIRKYAIQRITDNRILEEIIFSNDELYRVGYKNLKNIAIKQISDEAILFKIVVNYFKSPNPNYSLYIVNEAAKQVTDVNLLNKIINLNDNDLTEIAISNLKQQQVDTSKYYNLELKRQADDDNISKRLNAINEINDDDLLLEIAMNGKYLDSRRKAINKIHSTTNKINILKEIIDEEQDYLDAAYESSSFNHSSEYKPHAEMMMSKAKKLEEKYNNIGNMKKAEKYQNEYVYYKNRCS